MVIQPVMPAGRRAAAIVNGLVRKSYRREFRQVPPNPRRFGTLLDEAHALFTAPILLSRRSIMRTLWWIPLSIVAIGAGFLWRARRSRRDVEITPPPVSGQWLAEARSREDYPW